MSISTKLVFVLGIAGLVAACAPPPEPEIAAVPITYEDPVLTKY